MTSSKNQDLRFQNKKIIKLVGAFALIVNAVAAEACSGNSTCNSTATDKLGIGNTKPVSQTINDTKVGAASSESHHVVEGLTAYSKFNTIPEGGFQPSPFLGLVAPEVPRSREVVGFGEAIPVPLHETHPPSYLRHRLYPQRGYAAKPNLPIVHSNHLQDDIQYSAPPPHLGIGSPHLPIQEQHHEIPGHNPDLSVQAEISVQPEPTPLPGFSSRPEINAGPDLSGRHPSFPGQTLKLPGYHLSEHFPHHVHDSISVKPDFGVPLHHHSQSPVIFPEEVKFGKETYPGQLTYQLPHDIKPVEEEQHEDGLPSHVDAHTPTLKGHIPTQESLLHKLGPWKGVVKFLATLVPLGLLVAALQPSVLIVNATDAPLRPIPGVGVGVGVPPGVGVLTKFRTVGEELVASGDGEACDKRQLCEALVSSATTAANLQLAYVALATRLRGEQKRGLDEVMERVAGRNCKYYSCPSLLAAPTPPT